MTSSYCSCPWGDAATSSASPTWKAAADSRSHSRQTSGWTSPSQPASFPPMRTLAERPGWRNGCGCGLELDVGAELRRQRLEHALHGEEVGGTRLDAPARRSERPSGQGGDGTAARTPAADGRPRTRPRGRHRPAILRGRGRRARTRTALRGRRRERGCSGRRRGASRAASSAAPSGRATADWRPGSARPAQRRPRSRSRAGRPGSARLRVTIPSKPEVPHHVLGAPAQRLLAGQAAALARRLREGGGKVLVVAVDATHLLHQVGLAADVVVAVGGHLGDRCRPSERSTPKPSRSR